MQWNIDRSVYGQEPEIAADYRRIKASVRPLHEGFFGGLWLVGNTPMETCSHFYWQIQLKGLKSNNHVWIGVDTGEIFYSYGVLSSIGNSNQFRFLAPMSKTFAGSMVIQGSHGNLHSNQEQHFELGTRIFACHLDWARSVLYIFDGNRLMCIADYKSSPKLSFRPVFLSIMVNSTTAEPVEIYLKTFIKFEESLQMLALLQLRNMVPVNLSLYDAIKADRFPKCFFNYANLYPWLFGGVFFNKDLWDRLSINFIKSYFFFRFEQSRRN